MSLLNKSDLSEANSSKAIKNLEKDKEDAESMINVIQDFIDSSKEVLVGDSFDAVRNHMQEYINLLQTRIKMADSLIASVKSANETMINYMGVEDTLDTDRLDIYKQQLTLIESNRNSIEARLNNYDADKETVSYSYLKDQLDSLNADVDRYKTKIDLTERLDATDASTYSTLLESEVELTSFKNNVGGVRTISI